MKKILNYSVCAVYSILQLAIYVIMWYRNRKFLIIGVLIMRIKKSGLAKTLSLCLALSAAFICPSVGSHAEDDIWSYDNVLSGYQLVYGDANTDGEINAGDSVSILSYCTGTQSPNAMQLLNAGKIKLIRLKHFFMRM